MKNLISSVFILFQKHVEACFLHITHGLAPRNERKYPQLPDSMYFTYFCRVRLIIPQIKRQFNIFLEIIN